MARNRMVPNGRSLAEQDNPRKQKTKSDLSLAAAFGLQKCSVTFSRATGIQMKKLRAFKSGREKPTTAQTETIIRVASEQGWKPPVKDGI